MQALYQLDAGGSATVAEAAALAAPEDAPPSPAMVAEVERVIADVWQRRDALDAHIRAVARHWDISRMATVDRGILRLATYELITPGEASDAIIIDEAIRLAKTFGTADSPAFVNGILDAIRRRRDAGDATVQT